MDYSEVDAYNANDDFDLVEEVVSKPQNKLEAPAEKEWFHGPLGREDADKILLAKGREGSYLIRESVRDPGDFSLSFRIATGVKHFKIINEWGDFYIGGRRFESLPDLVSYYMSTFLTGNLCLKYPLAPEGASNAGAGSRNTVLALYSYNKATPDELSFGQGDMLMILNSDDPSWWWARMETGPYTGEVGFIPSTLVQLIEKVVPPRERWFHGAISRKEAERILLQEAQDGAFLIRESENKPGDFSLSFRVLNVVKHFRIEASGKLYTCGGRTFNTIEDVIARYLREPLTDNRTLTDPHPPGRQVESDYAFVDRPAALQAAVEITRQVSATMAPPPVPKRDTSSNQTRGTSYNKTGYLVKKSRKSKKWKRLYFAIMGAKKRLYYFDNEQALKPKGIVDLTTSNVYYVHDTFFGIPNCFQIIQKSIDEQTFYLAANTDDEQQGWVDVLKEFCGNDTVARPVPGEELMEIKSLQLTVSEARDLPSKIPHPYCIVSLDNVKIARTQIKPRSQPFWGEEFNFDDLHASFSTCSVVVFNKNKLQKDVEMARVVLNLDSLKVDKAAEVWYDLKSMDDKEKMGGIRIKAKFANELILPLVEYGEIKQYILKPDLAVIKAIGNVGKEREEIARTLLKVFQCEGTANDFVRNLNAFEVNSTDDPNTIFRGNSLATKAMDQYMKITAISYLHNTIGDHIKEIFEDKHSCEMDPTRLPKGADPAANLKRLLYFLNNIWESIQKSLESCPTELRTVFYYLQQDVIQRFPSDTVARYSAISGFIFLRLFCPAILNPKLFSMMSDHPTESISRSLTLIAKSLQNLANLVEFKAKEPFMHPVNPFIIENKESMKRFIDNLSTVPQYPSFAKLPQINAARELAAVHRFCLRNKEAMEKYAKENKNPVLDGFMAAADRLVVRERTFLHGSAAGNDGIYQNLPKHK